MALTALEKPSVAKEFFLKLVKDPNPAEAINRLVGATPPVFETEWLDFKGAQKIGSQQEKKIWSEALSGFANTQGGVLIWGIDARKDEASGIDAASGLSLVPHPAALKSRLNELHAQATDPPVLGVEIEAFCLDSTSGEGFVICFVPESPFRPHRAESANRQFLIRAGDDFVTASVSLLRNLFFPQTRCLLIPSIQAMLTDNGTAFQFQGLLRNAGSATAADTFAIVHYHPILTTCRIDGWQTGPTLNPCHCSARIPIHPGAWAFFFSGICGQQTGAYQFSFRIQIFAKDAEPAEWNISFNESEVKSGCSKGGARRFL